MISGSNCSKYMIGNFYYLNLIIFLVCHKI